MIVGNARLCANFFQAIARIQREIETLNRVVASARRQAFEQELQSPAPLLRIEAQPEQQWRVFLAQPLQDLERGSGVGPRLRIRCRDLAPIGERSFESGTAVPVDDGDVVAILREIPRSGDADDTRTKHQNTHQADSFPVAEYSCNGMQLQKRFRSP